MLCFGFCFPKATEAVNSKMTDWHSIELIGYQMRSFILSGLNLFIDPGFVLLFIQGLIPILERLMMTKWIGFESVTKVIECKQKMLSSWNGVFAAKSRWGVNELWGLWHCGSVLTFIKKSLFVDNSRTFLYFTYIFWEMIP